MGCYFSRCRVHMTPWTLAHQGSMSMGFPRQENWVGCHFLLQEIFLTHRSNLHLLFGRRILYHWITWEASPLVVRELSCFSWVQLCATLWIAACQAPLSLEFPRKTYWSGLYFLIQRIFPTQGSNLHLLHWQVGCLPLAPIGSPLVGQMQRIQLRSLIT